MTLLWYFISIILFSNLYTVVTRDRKQVSLGPKRNEKEELLEKFLMDAESLMQNCPSRHTTIIASSNQLMRAVTTIFKDRPYFVGIHSKIFVESREYVIENCVFVFVDTIDYDHLSTTFSHLPKHYNTKVQIVSTIGMLEEEVKETLDLAYNKSIENVTITFLEHNEFKVFQVYPFTRNCKREVRLSYVWVPDKGVEAYNYDDYSPRNLNKCPVTISTLPAGNAIIVHENPNGTLTVLGGLDGKLILTFAQKLNFTAVVKYPEIRVWEHVVNNTVAGLVGDIANRKSLIAIGYLLPTLRRYEYSDFTKSYDSLCVVWTTPAITASTEDILYSEFGTYLWAIVVLSIIFSCVFIYILPRISSNNRVRQSHIAVILDVIRATLGFPVHRLPTNRPGKIYFLAYIFYAIVVVTAYETYLASILTVRKDVQLIKTEADIAKSKLITGGSSNILSVLQSQRGESPYIAYLIDHYEVFIGTATALERIKYKKDFAFAFDVSTMQYYKQNLILAGKEIYFYSFDKCLLTYHQIILVRKGSALTSELDDTTVRLQEFGLINLWKNKKSNVDIKVTRKPVINLQKLNMHQLRSVFILYLMNIILSTIVFILEIIFHSLSKHRN